MVLRIRNVKVTEAVNDIWYSSGESGTVADQSFSLTGGVRLQKELSVWKTKTEKDPSCFRGSE